MLARESSSRNYSSEVQRLRKENRRLVSANSQLRSQNNLLVNLVDNVKVGMFIKNDKNTFTYVNQTFCDHLNTTPEKLLFKEKPRLEKALKKFINDDKKVIKTRSVVFNLIENKDSQGRSQWIETVKFPLLENPHQAAGVYGFTYDTTDAVQARNGLQRSRIDLKKAQILNDALRQFSYAASHDLQEPLRSVQGILSVIKIEYNHQFDKQAENYFKKVDASLGRMQQLIKDILDYAVINGAKYHLEPVDLNQVVSQVVLNLDQTILDQQGTIEVDPLPALKGNESLLIHFFQNMISNALKYRSRNTNPKVRIFCETKPRNLLIGISDNGIGIDPAYFKEIFKPFKRLHRQSKIQGSGIGLATCKKIAEIHLGKIWVQSNLGEGATFYLEVPKK